MRLFGFEVEAVVFDCDGVLADTEPLSQRAWTRTLHAHGLSLDEAVFVGLVGGTERQSAERFSAQLGVAVEELEAVGRRALLELLEGGVDVFPDGVALLERLLEREIPVALASNSFRWRLDAVLRASRLAGRVGVAVAGDEVLHPKPAPDIYLACATRLAVPPARCLVLEDSPTGIEAGRRAGMTVVAIDRGMFSTAQLGAAHLVVPTLEPEEALSR